MCFKNEIDKCDVRGYELHMIVGFRHKGLERFYKTGSTSGINAQHAPKLRRLPTALDIRRRTR